MNIEIKQNPTVEGIVNSYLLYQHKVFKYFTLFLIILFLFPMYLIVSEKTIYILSGIAVLLILIIFIFYKEIVFKFHYFKYSLITKNSPELLYQQEITLNSTGIKIKQQYYSFEMNYFQFQSVVEKNDMFVFYVNRLKCFYISKSLLSEEEISFLKDNLKIQCKKFKAIKS